MSDGRGGARAGAGRKPKELRYWPVAQNVEDKIAHALPAIIEKLIDMAKDGDVSAARYLCDRILGRTAALEAPPAFDRTMPYTDHDFENFAKQHRPHLLDPEEEDTTPSCNESAPAPSPESHNSKPPPVSEAPIPDSGSGHADSCLPPLAEGSRQVEHSDSPSPFQEEGWGGVAADSSPSLDDDFAPESADSDPPTASEAPIPAAGRARGAVAWTESQPVSFTITARNEGSVHRDAIP